MSKTIQEMAKEYEESVEPEVENDTGNDYSCRQMRESYIAGASKMAETKDAEITNLTAKLKICREALETVLYYDEANSFVRQALAKIDNFSSLPGQVAEKTKGD